MIVITTTRPKDETQTNTLLSCSVHFKFLAHNIQLTAAFNE